MIVRGKDECIESHVNYGYQKLCIHVYLIFFLNYLKPPFSVFSVAD